MNRSHAVLFQVAWQECVGVNATDEQWEGAQVHSSSVCTRYELLHFTVLHQRCSIKTSQSLNLVATFSLAHMF